MSTMEQVEVGKYQPYPEYKDSGVEWLGLVPKHWDVCGFKRHILRNDGGVWGDEPSGVDDTMVLRSTEQTVDGRWIIEQPAFRQLSQSEKVSALLIENDLVITKSSGSANHIGKTALVTSKLAALQCCYSNFMQRVRTHSSFLPKLAWYVMNNRIAREQFNVASNSTIGLANLNGGMIGQLMVVVPPIAEQQTIVAFLDYETARIDKLIAQQQRLIELLKEKRQAVISHAVTKGLNPDAPMKDSGVEWLGTVPKHWVVLSLRYVIRTLEQGKSPECEARLAENDEWAVLKTGCVNGGIYSEKEHKALPSHISPHVSFEVKRGDLLMSRASGSRNLIGAVAYVHETRQKLLLSDKIFRLILEPNIDPQYLSLLMSSRPLRVQVEQAINGAEGLANNITKESIKSFAIVLPDVQEQLKIRSYLNQKLRKFENFEDKLKGGLVLLNERRSSLISSAVTGKIDLRSWEKPDA
ncbi:restriction endonuclease subunit S [Klebsiella pneumoniae]|nr:restriction endonuclease subunit S [Klebsiella pneumoniae]SSG08310.1 putative restriction endonuclease S subunit [Klebsiella pneumoniae]HBW2202505.1 restriction endonuclease subunit S [Klebsiella pneumoniae]HBX7579188.1 restriction endonuclease subunit S [Klebsiella pneumoniae]HBY9437521.1 restriction endonuclease subunit S [Klebsiella pneumoniae]